MKIWVDADSCPRAVRDTVQKAALRLSIEAEFIANKAVAGLEGEQIIFTLCPPGKDGADDLIVAGAKTGDLVISRDVILAERLVKEGIAVIDDRGNEYNSDNIRERLSLRNFNVGLALDGLGGPREKVWGPRDLQNFANAFDRILTKLSQKASKKNL